MKNLFTPPFFRLSLPLLALMLACAACTSPERIPAVPSTPSEGLPLLSTSPTPQYAAFTPWYETVFQLTFDYPADWKDVYYEGDGWAKLNIYDPTKLPPDADLTPDVDTDNSIVISVVRGEHLKLRESVERRLNVERDLAAGKKKTPECENCVSPLFSDEKIIDNIILEDRVTEIAGYPAYFMSTQGTRVSGETRKALFTRTVYILAEDRLYSFHLGMLADEKDGPFGQGFNYLISTIRPYPEE